MPIGGRLAAVFRRGRYDGAGAAVALYSLGSPALLDRATAEIAARLREWQLLGPDVVALDIGCGIGRIERALASEVAAITGIDLSPAMVGEARRRAAGLANVEFLCTGGGDLSALVGRCFGLVQRIF